MAGILSKRGTAEDREIIGTSSGADECNARAVEIEAALDGKNDSRAADEERGKSRGGDYNNDRIISDGGTSSIIKTDDIGFGSGTKVGIAEPEFAARTRITTEAKIGMRGFDLNSLPDEEFCSKCLFVGHPSDHTCDRYANAWQGSKTLTAGEIGTGGSCTSEKPTVSYSFPDVYPIDKGKQKYSNSLEKVHQLRSKFMKMKMTCPICAHPYPSDALVCDRCDTTFSGISPTDEIGGGIRNMRVREEMEHLEIPDGFKVCKKCMLLNSCHATECAVCHSIFDLGSRSLDFSTSKSKISSEESSEDDEMEEESSTKVITCQLCDKVCDPAYELEFCKHGFCRPCVVFAVAEKFLALPPVDDASLDDALVCLPCPVMGCGHPLSRQDIRTIAGQDVLGFIDDWLLGILDHGFTSALQKKCPYCWDTVRPNSLISADYLDDLELYDIQHALAARGLICDGSKADCLKTLKDALMHSGPSSRFSLCRSCDFFVCDDCGQSLSFSRDTDRVPASSQHMASTSCVTHECEPNKKQCFAIWRCVLELSSAYDAYTKGNKILSNQQKEEVPDNVKSWPFDDSTPSISGEVSSPDNVSEKGQLKFQQRRSGDGILPPPRTSEHKLDTKNEHISVSDFFSKEAKGSGPFPSMYQHLGKKHHHNTSRGYTFNTLMKGSTHNSATAFSSPEGQVDKPKHLSSLLKSWFESSSSSAVPTYKMETSNPRVPSSKTVHSSFPHGASPSTATFHKGLEQYVLSPCTSTSAASCSQSPAPNQPFQTLEIDPKVKSQRGGVPNPHPPPGGGVPNPHTQPGAHANPFRPFYSLLEEQLQLSSSVPVSNQLGTPVQLPFSDGLSSYSPVAPSWNDNQVPNQSIPFAAVSQPGLPNQKSANFAQFFSLKASSFVPLLTPAHQHHPSTVSPPPYFSPKQILSEQDSISEEELEYMMDLVESPNSPSYESYFKNPNHGHNKGGFSEYGQHRRKSGPSETRRAAAAEVEKMADTQMKVALFEITILLSTLSEAGSRLLPLSAALLCSHDVPRKSFNWFIKNDSLMDITSRCEVYSQFFSFLHSLAMHSDLLPVLCSPNSKYDCWTQQRRWQTQGTLMVDFEKVYKQAVFMFSKHQQELGGLDDEEAGMEIALVADVKKTYEQLKLQLKKWERRCSHPWNEDARDLFYQAMVNFSAKDALLKSLYPGKEQPSTREGFLVVDCAFQTCEKNTMPDHQHADSGENLMTRNFFREAERNVTMPSTEEIEGYKKALQPLQFRQESLLVYHYFRQTMSRNLSNKLRSRVIMKEIALLNTNLPLEWESSIHVRVDDCRMDMLKALIIGPAGTPYQNGIFLFDLMLSDDYPNLPPQMQFLTTGGGRVRFNPNLYNDGTVCLSLLGTWHGPSWQPFESTILQLLVSVQSLVLVDNPYFNEPGYASHMTAAHCAAAKRYNQQQQLNTLLYSILPSLRQPDPLFADVILTHFRKKRREIEEQCMLWAEEKTSLKGEMMKAVEDVKNELNKLM